jgi:oxygen-independent coproporphyrinogen-3 oxidase
MAADALVAGGYVAVGIDHFARPTDRLAQAAAEGRLRRNFQGYTTDDSTCLIGLGASAISSLPAGYAQNATDVRSWRERILFRDPATVRGIALSADDLMRRAVIERLMCDLAVDLDAIAARHGTTRAAFDDAVSTLAGLARLGVIDTAGPVVRVRTEARPLARVVASAFDTYLAAGFGRHSVAV